jgi:hypothetical protein
MGSRIGMLKRWAKIYPNGVLQRFNEKVNKNGPVLIKELDNCWLWLGTTTGKSHGEYGTFWTGEKIVTAHRFSLEQILGRKLKKNRKALHHCDNSMCVRPTHLYEGTQGDNMIDAYKRSRRSGKKQSAMLLKARKIKLGY